MEQIDLFSRSFLGECTDTVDYDGILDTIKKEWRLPGKVIFRDLGPRKCLITMDSVELKHEAMSNPVMLSLFDEIRPHWEFVWNSCRRIWVELMGIPVHAWSSDMFQRVAKLWGRLWIILRVDGREFEVFAKEFGGEIYNVQIHPYRSSNQEDSDRQGNEIEYRSMEVSQRTISVVEETRLEGEEIRNVTARDPLIEDINNRKWDFEVASIPRGEPFEEHEEPFHCM
ncbi:hypothetical protein PIB30_074735 [Stylosanthes scabra]|uniref:DUF4283 domain-containing protein n=1 Tax=Stylosanthes scabra TaxID=79078 RepID=A0ABU6ZNI7_9FABA|nr:hypothetical protein [Stylosanthes scabra]